MVERRNCSAKSTIETCILDTFYVCLLCVASRRIEIEGESHNVDDLRKVSCQLSHHSDISPAALALAVLRNFGGRCNTQLLHKVIICLCG